MSRPPYFVDPEDPRAPSQELWDAMSDEERVRVVDALPSEIESAYPPESRVLGLELSLEGDRLRLYTGTAAVPELEELATRGERLLADAIARVEEAEKRAEQEAQRAEQEAQRAEQEAQRADRAERELAALRAELSTLRAGRQG